MTERRWLYLENADKAHRAETATIRRELIDLSAEFTSLAAKIDHKPLLPVLLRARVLRQTVQASGEHEPRGDREMVEHGKSILVMYPMVQRDDGTWMRRLVVDPDTAALEWGWIRIYNQVDNVDNVFVGDFE